MAERKLGVAEAVARAGEWTSGPNWRVFAILVGLVAIPIVLVDQLTKICVASHLRLYQSIPVIPNWFDITYTQNPGAAFSMFATLPPAFRSGFLFVLSAGAIVVLLVLIARSDSLSLLSLAFALILAGATGNLIDRAVRGRVIDFFRAHYYDLNYPIFNVADSAITIGVTLIVIATLFFSRAESE